MAAGQLRYISRKKANFGLHTDYEPLFRAIIVQRILYSFLSIYLDRAEQGVDTLGCQVGNYQAALPSFQLF